MKPPVTFPCRQCRKLIGVALEHSGRAVTCPHCRAVVTAPAAAALHAPVADAGIAEQHARSFSAQRQEFQEREESIFGEAVEDDDEALFGLGSGKKPPAVDMPETSTAAAQNTPVRLSPPTQRVPGLPPPPAISLPRPQLGMQPVVKVPVDEADAQSFTASASSFASPNGLPADANPFQMEAAIPTEFSEPAASAAASTRRRKEAAPGDAPNWKSWIIIGLAAYSFLMTAVAVWGWMRSPPAAPGKADPLTPATQKAKPR
jgi:hypothetical protein